MSRRHHPLADAVTVRRWVNGLVPTDTPLLVTSLTSWDALRYYRG